MKFKMPGGVSDMDNSGIIDNQHEGNYGRNGNETVPPEKEAEQGKTQGREEAREDTGTTATDRNVGPQSNRLRTRNQLIKNDEIIPAHATVILTPADA